MTPGAPSIIFALRTAFRDAENLKAGSGDAVLAVPHITPYASTLSAVADIEGLEIAEGGVALFAAEGAPLHAVFSERPYVEDARNRYFAGVYTLHKGDGEGLTVAINRILSGNGGEDGPVHVLMPDTDEGAQDGGWPALSFMKADVEKALKMLPPELERRIVFIWGETA
ncbi:MAG: hypothetical protein GC185_03440 [Alphaproteobacteria bacterium]|nr:hypothetical protein [Alphaproteobacteria bacterium]